MNLEDAKQQFQQDRQATIPAEFSSIVTGVRAAEKFESVIHCRDFREAAAAGLIVVLLAPLLFTFKESLAWLGVWVVLLAALETILVMRWIRKRNAATPVDAQLGEYFRLERLRVDDQIWLLKNVVWWYLAPFLTGYCMIIIGKQNAGLMRGLPYCMLGLIVGAVIYFVNRRSVLRSLLPLRTRLTKLEQEFE